MLIYRLYSNKLNAFIDIYICNFLNINFKLTKAMLYIHICNKYSIIIFFLYRYNYIFLYRMFNDFYN